MHCVECGNPLPDIRDSSTACSKCKTLVATWWDETSNSHRIHRETLLPFSAEQVGTMSQRRNSQTIEERNFQAALICLELHFETKIGLGPKTMPEVKKNVGKTLDLSLNKSDVRESLAKNVDIWMRLQKIFNLALPILNSRSLRDSYAQNSTLNEPGTSENASLILKNYDVLVRDLHFLNSLLVISRNMLAIKDTAQEICAAVQFDHVVRELVVLCVNVTSKSGYDGDNMDDVSRGKLNEVGELYKKLLVTSLQHMHNWTMGNDRFKMLFWFEMLFDGELHNDTIHELPPDNLNVEKVYAEVKNWIRRHSRKDKLAARLLDKYTADVKSGVTPGPLPPPQDDVERDGTLEESKTPVWRPELEDKYEQDRLYARVSHEIDIWWKFVRDANYEGWVVPMETVEGAMARAEACKENAMHRYMPRGNDPHYDGEDEYDVADGAPPLVYGENAASVIDYRSRDENGELIDDEEDEEEEEEDEDDDESYVEGPLRGLLTEIPNILDTKQIEALHMTVKACIVDSMGSGLTPAGENLQKTRCKMFLALDCGKNLLRELLVFIAVWEQTDQQFIFQITAQIIESFHHNALLPYAWNSLRILKDIVSPAQTVLLRLINYMFRARKDSSIYDDLKDYNRDAKLIHFLYTYFRCRVVPDCMALIYAQAQIRLGSSDPAEFPVDLWDMERAKDGLSQYLELISVIAEISEMRTLLIEWEAVYELIALLKALEAGVERKPLVDPVRRPHLDGTPTSRTEYHNTPHEFPWAGIKNQILIIMASLVAPTNARRNGPGNPTVQKQILDRGGIMPLLNCCAYDGHNEYLKERATVAMKYVMDGCEEAQQYVRDMVPVANQKPQQGPLPAQNGASGSVPDLTRQMAAHKINPATISETREGVEALRRGINAMDSLSDVNKKQVTEQLEKITRAASENPRILANGPTQAEVEQYTAQVLSQGGLTPEQVEIFHKMQAQNDILKKALEEQPKGAGR